MQLRSRSCTYDKERICMENLDLKSVQKAALSLIQNDLRFLYTVIKELTLMNQIIFLRFWHIWVL